MLHLDTKKTASKILCETLRNLGGQRIEEGERVKVRNRSKEDPFLFDIVSVAKPKRIIKNVSKKCFAVKA